MRRYGFLFFAFLLLASSGCIKREIKNIGASGKNIICFGDSLTFGYGALRGEDYPTQLGKMLPIPVINSGIDGDTTSEAMGRLGPDVLEKEPTLVIIEFGGNDFLRKTPEDVTLANISDMIDLIQKKGAMVAIADISAGMFLAEYRRGFFRLAREKQAIFIPGIMRGIITNPSMKSDFLHPNGAGYKLIAQRVYQAILPYLGQNCGSNKPKK
ncbi:MAG TPA: GDSL-type esterase/lipase family protein [Candidatus Margulisiibacteriota bacterium]|nr:GDSL-type esterase/lipase family protein [Candidatus Margulisiibacteriota bacterium]